MAQIFAKLLKKKNLQFIFEENKISQSSVSVSVAMITGERGLTLRFPTCPSVQGACRDEHHQTVR